MGFGFVFAVAGLLACFLGLVWAAHEGRAGWQVFFALAMVALGVWVALTGSWLG